MLKAMLQFLSKAEGGTIVADVYLLGVVEYKVKIFYLPRFEENQKHIFFLHGSLSPFFLHVHIYKLKTKPSRIVPREPIPMYENNKLVKRLIKTLLQQWPFWKKDTQES